MPPLARICLLKIISKLGFPILPRIECGLVRVLIVRRVDIAYEPPEQHLLIATL